MEGIWTESVVVSRLKLRERVSHPLKNRQNYISVNLSFQVQKCKRKQTWPTWSCNARWQAYRGLQEFTVFFIWTFSNAGMRHNALEGWSVDVSVIRIAFGLQQAMTTSVTWNKPYACSPLRPKWLPPLHSSLCFKNYLTFYLLEHSVNVVSSSKILSDATT